MLKKCLIFTLILTISYLYPINSKAQSGLNQLGPAKDICVCSCIDFGNNTIYSDDKCQDPDHDFNNISDAKQCSDKNGQLCRGYAYIEDLMGGLNGFKCEKTDGFKGNLTECHIESVPDDGG